MSRKSLTIDLHPIYNQGDKIDASLEEAIAETEGKKLIEIEIICGREAASSKSASCAFSTART